MFRRLMSVCAFALCLLFGIFYNVDNAEAQQNSRCFVLTRRYLSPNERLIDHVGDKMELYFKGTVEEAQRGKTKYFDIDLKYAYRSEPILLERTSSAWGSGGGCSLDDATTLEVFVLREASGGSVKGVVTSDRNLMRWVKVGAWNVNIQPVTNFDTCIDGSGKYKGDDFPCASPIPYWSSDDYASWNADILLRRVLLEKNGLRLGILGGFTLSQTKYIFVTGEEQFAHYQLAWNDAAGTLYVFDYRNAIYLQTTSTSNTTRYGFALGGSVSKRVGRFTLGFELRHDLFAEAGKDSVRFLDTDDQHYCVWNTKTGIPEWCADDFLDGSIDFPAQARQTPFGSASRTSLDFSANYRFLNKFGFLDGLEALGGLTLRYTNSCLTTSVKNMWGLVGGNRAPEGIDTWCLPQRQGNRAGFSLRGAYLGLKANVF